MSLVADMPAYVGLGANLGEPQAQIENAFTQLDELPQTSLTARSSLFRSAPLGEPGQADYCNAVAELRTRLPARALLESLLAIEQTMGRQRNGRRWGPRIIDLDLLVYGDAVISEPGMTVPHPELARRKFVLIPLAEIAPRLDIPGLGQAAALADSLGKAGIGPWEGSA